MPRKCNTRSQHIIKLFLGPQRLTPMQIVFILKTNHREASQTVASLHVKRLLLSSILTIMRLSPHILVQTQNPQFHDNPSGGSSPFTFWMTQKVALRMPTRLKKNSESLPSTIWVCHKSHKLLSFLAQIDATAQHTTQPNCMDVCLQHSYLYPCQLYHWKGETLLIIHQSGQV